MPRDWPRNNQFSTVYPSMETLKGACIQQLLIMPNGGWTDWCPLGTLPWRCLRTSEFTQLTRMLLKSCGTDSTLHYWGGYTQLGLSPKLRKLYLFKFIRINLYEGLGLIRKRQAKGIKFHYVLSLLTAACKSVTSELKVTALCFNSFSWTVCL